MIAVLQRVKESSVSIDGERISQIESGFMILLGVFDTDSETDADFLAAKTSVLRVFSDEAGKMNRSITDIGGSALVVSQFTLCGDWLKGRRPGFTNAAPPEKGEKLYLYFCRQLEKEGIPVQTGRFGAMMEVALINDGPVTFVLDSKLKGKN
ncbi:MAG TPA: D-tyrosyl-tRNA(Tyr) deacylase [Candidatus Marinimicrobia bacterium]|nr:D-tyrosyl-tRNA(Tyr) deacylase [Candidatus Neomarinimicrobiota bacterium]